MEQSGARRVYSPERLVAYSDAIFSIAVTLLVLDIRIPEDPAAGLLVRIAGAWPSILAFLVSFLIITVVWFNHHEMFHHIGKVDQRILVMNTLLTLNIALIPFAASVLSQSMLDPGIDASIGSFVYGIWIALGGVPFNLLWNHASRTGGLLREDADLSAVNRLRRHYAFGPFLYAAAAASAFISHWLSIALYGLLLALYFVPSAVSRKP